MQIPLAIPIPGPGPPPLQKQEGQCGTVNRGSKRNFFMYTLSLQYGWWTFFFFSQCSIWHLRYDSWIWKFVLSKYIYFFAFVFVSLVWEPFLIYYNYQKERVLESLMRLWFFLRLVRLCDTIWDLDTSWYFGILHDTLGFQDTLWYFKQLQVSHETSWYFKSPMRIRDTFLDTFLTYIRSRCSVVFPFPFFPCPCPFRKVISVWSYLTVAERDQGVYIRKVRENPPPP